MPHPNRTDSRGTGCTSLLNVLGPSPSLQGAWAAPLLWEAATPFSCVCASTAASRWAPQNNTPHSKLPSTQHRLPLAREGTSIEKSWSKVSGKQRHCFSQATVAQQSRSGRGSKAVAAKSSLTSSHEFYACISPQPRSSLLCARKPRQDFVRCFQKRKLFFGTFDHGDKEERKEERRTTELV